MRVLTEIAYRRAAAEVRRAAREVVTVTPAYDLLLSPALAERPVRIGTITGLNQPDPSRGLSRDDRFMPYTALWNMTVTCHLFGTVPW